MASRNDAAVIHGTLMKISAKLEAQNKNLVPLEFEKLTMAEARAVIMLRDGVARPMGIIAEMLKVAVSTATSTVDRLVAKDLAARSLAADDRRKWLVELTPRGKALVAEMEKRAIVGTQSFLARLSGSEVAFLRKILEKIDGSL